MPDLSTTYLGLELKNPLVPSSTPLSHALDAVLHLEDAGAAAIVVMSAAKAAEMGFDCVEIHLRNPAPRVPMPRG